MPRRTDAAATGSAATGTAHGPSKGTVHITAMTAVDIAVGSDPGCGATRIGANRRRTTGGSATRTTGAGTVAVTASTTISIRSGISHIATACYGIGTGGTDCGIRCTTGTTIGAID